MAEDRTPQDADKYIVRFPDGMRDALKRAAKENNRTLNAEIVHRLQLTLESDEAAFLAGFESETELRAAQRLKATVGSGAQQVAEAMGHKPGTPSLEQAVQALSSEMREMLQRQTEELVNRLMAANEMEKNASGTLDKLLAIKPPTKTGKGK